MVNMDIVEIQNRLIKKLSEHRYTHTMGVQYTSICLAMKYECDLRKAQMAGLLHDCAKYLDAEKLLKICKKNDIPVTEIEHKSPYLLHGKVGAHFAMKKYGVEDEDILNAIRFHTTGKPDMSLLEKIVFVADYIEPGRTNAPNLSYLRKLSFENLDEAVFEILAQTLSFLEKKKQNIDQHTVETYQFYKDLLGRNKFETNK